MREGRASHLAKGFTVLHMDRKAYAARDGALTTDVLNLLQK
jgi:hypothetical protein